MKFNIWKAWNIATINKFSYDFTTPNKKAPHFISVIKLNFYQKMIALKFMNGNLWWAMFDEDLTRAMRICNRCSCSCANYLGSRLVLTCIVNKRNSFKAKVFTQKY